MQRGKPGLVCLPAKETYHRPSQTSNHPGRILPHASDTRAPRRVLALVGPWASAARAAHSGRRTAACSATLRAVSPSPQPPRSPTSPSRPGPAEQPDALLVEAAAYARAPDTAEPTPAGTSGERQRAALVVDLEPAARLAALDALLVGPNPARAMHYLERAGALAVLLPEVQALVDLHLSAPAHHKDMWEHTLRVLEACPPDPDLRWGALLHDVGKAMTRGVSSAGRVTFWRHEAVGAFLFQGIAARLHFPPERATRVGAIVALHGRVNGYERGWSDRAVARLARELGPHLEDLLAFSRADVTSGRAQRRAKVRADLDHLEGRLRALAEARLRAQSPRPLPRAVGKRLAERRRAGPAIREDLAWLEAQIGAGALPAGAEPQVYLDALDARDSG